LSIHTTETHLLGKTFKAIYGESNTGRRKIKKKANKLPSGEGATISGDSSKGRGAWVNSYITTRRKKKASRET